jgi:hypothetical protein
MIVIEASHHAPHQNLFRIERRGAELFACGKMLTEEGDWNAYAKERIHEAFDRGPCFRDDPIVPDPVGE